MLGADGQADGVLVDPLLGQLSASFSWLWVVEAGWMTRLFTSATLASREKIFRLSMNLKASSLAALDIKGKDGGAAVGEILLDTARGRGGRAGKDG